VEFKLISNISPKEIPLKVFPND